MTTELLYYENIDVLPLWNWDRYTATKDNNFFIEGYDGRAKKVSNERLIALENELQEQYFKAIDDSGFTKRLQKWARVNNLITKYNILTALLHRFSLGFADFQMDVRHEFVKAINKFGFNMQELNSIDGDREEIIRINNEIQGIKTQIVILQDELKIDAVKETRSLNFQLKLMSKALQLGFSLNAKEITVLEYIEMQKEIYELSKKN
jgi:hypothetical protein